MISVKGDKLMLSIKAANARGIPDTPIGTTEGGLEFSRCILNDEPVLNVELARKDNINSACALVQSDPSIGALVLECTNMVPYAADIATATGLPVYSMYNLISWFEASLAPPQFTS